MKTYRFFYDPGHAWLEVDVSEILKLNLADKISEYSYINPTTGKVYLEEDIDAGIFINAKGLKREHVQEIEDINESIRKLSRYGN